MKTKLAAWTDEELLSLGREALLIEAEAVSSLAERLGDAFVAAVRLIGRAVSEERGRLILSGIGKSGHIARKIASTLTSTGAPAYFVHATEASHGDLGLIRREDVLLAISHSGESEELLHLLPEVRRRGGKVIAMTGKPMSSLAREADIHLNAAVAKEACPLNLAPTASSTAALALGDALAVALLKAQGFSETDFARSHPGGSLGRRLLTHVRDVMRPCSRCPLSRPDTQVTDAILTMSKGGLGMTVIVDDRQIVQGIFTDGDLRRAFADKLPLLDETLTIGSLMHRSPYTIVADALAVVAVEMMQTHRINQLLVVDQDGVLLGALNMHDLFQAGIV